MNELTSSAGSAPSSSAAGTGPHQVELEEWISCAPFEEHLKMEIVQAAEGESTLRMPFLYQHAQGDALMHGGALVSLADTALVMAIKSTVAAGTRFVTVKADIEYLAPVTQGVVTAKAKITGRDNRKLYGEVAVFDEGQTQVIVFSAMFVLLKEQ